jgi:uncharacterized membrane protein YhaH (DUF805 family)
MNLLLRPWRHYADFRGRSRRLEYLLFVLTFYGAIFVMGIVAMGALGATIKAGGAPGADPVAPVIGTLALLWFAVCFLPGLALTVRRLHDLGISGWWLMIAFVPIIGQILAWLLMFIIIFIPAPRGENQYGHDPRDPDDEDDSAVLSQVFS